MKAQKTGSDFFDDDISLLHVPPSPTRTMGGTVTEQSGRGQFNSKKGAMKAPKPQAPSHNIVFPVTNEYCIANCGSRGDVLLVVDDMALVANGEGTTLYNSAPGLRLSAAPLPSHAKESASVGGESGSSPLKPSAVARIIGSSTASTRLNAFDDVFHPTCGVLIRLPKGSFEGAASSHATAKVPLFSRNTTNQNVFSVALAHCLFGSKIMFATSAHREVSQKCILLGDIQGKVRHGFISSASFGSSFPAQKQPLSILMCLHEPIVSILHLSANRHHPDALALVTSNGRVRIIAPLLSQEPGGHFYPESNRNSSQQMQYRDYQLPGSTVAAAVSAGEGLLYRTARGGAHYFTPWRKGKAWENFASVAPSLPSNEATHQAAQEFKTFVGGAALGSNYSSQAPLDAAKLSHDRSSEDVDSYLVPHDEADRGLEKINASVPICAVASAACLLQHGWEESTAGTQHAKRPSPPSPKSLLASIHRNGEILVLLCKSSSWQRLRKAKARIEGEDTALQRQEPWMAALVQAAEEGQLASELRQIRAFNQEKRILEGREAQLNLRMCAVNTMLGPSLLSLFFLLLSPFVCVCVCVCVWMMSTETAI